MKFGDFKIGDKLLWPDRDRYWDLEIVSGGTKIIASRDSSKTMGDFCTHFGNTSFAEEWIVVPGKERLFDKLYLTLKYEKTV